LGLTLMFMLTVVSPLVDGLPLSSESEINKAVAQGYCGSTASVALDDRSVWRCVPLPAAAREFCDSVAFDGTCSRLDSRGAWHDCPVPVASAPVLGACASAIGSWLMQVLGVVLALYILYSMWSRMVLTPFNAAIMAPRIVTGSSRHPRYQSDSQPSVQVVPGICRRRALGDGPVRWAKEVWRRCGPKNPWSLSSPDYVVDDPRHASFIIANSRPDDGYLPPNTERRVVSTCLRPPSTCAPNVTRSLINFGTGARFAHTVHTAHTRVSMVLRRFRCANTPPFYRKGEYKRSASIVLWITC
jgi:hypothetical protein